MSDTKFDHPMVSALALAVPLWIDKVRPNLDEEMKDVHRLAQVIAEKGDIIQFPSKKKGETAAAFNDMAKAIALLSFAPGGVTIFGMHFESSVDVRS